MRRIPMVAGNWKMHGSKSFVNDLLSALKTSASNLTDVELVVCPPFVYLDQAQQLLSHSCIRLGAQNIYPANEGAFTGEISASMLLELGCEYVIVGHSERRHLLGESEHFIIEKVAFCVQQGLKPILCLGETQAQREKDETGAVISQQLSNLLTHHHATSLLEKLVFAYEPVWAIGTGLTASPEQAQNVHEIIRQEITKIDKLLAENARILYGGSVKQSNAAALFAMPDIDGGLLGGASLNAKEFLEIAQLCH